MHSFGRTLPINPDHTETVQNAWHYYWKDCANQTVIEQFIEIGESLPEQDASIGDAVNRAINSEIRISKLSWINYQEEHKHLFDFLIDKIDRINYWHYGFKLDGMESLQYTRYPLNGHYEFHNDIVINKTPHCRKLSIVLSLTGPDDYEGGDFNLMPNGTSPTKLRFGKGDLIAFPSWVPHKVEPVTSGQRITLVAWACGPKFV